MSHVALAWINQRISSPIIGFSSTARMDEAIGANDKDLSEEEEAYLDEPYQAKGVAGFDTTLKIVSLHHVCAWTAQKLTTSVAQTNMICVDFAFGGVHTGGEACAHAAQLVILLGRRLLAVKKSHYSVNADEQKLTVHRASMMGTVQQW